MIARVGPVAMALVLAVSGCVSDDQKLTTVSSPSPFGDPGRKQSTQALHAPSTPSEKDAVRVVTLGRKIVEDNPQIGRQVAFTPIGAPEPEIFHRLNHDCAEVVLTEGLVRQCKTDGELAAVLCQELGKIASEQVALLRTTRNAQDRPPMMDPHVGNDIGGTFGQANGMDQIILARAEANRRQPRQPLPPPPAPDKLARLYLQNAGYSAANLDTVAPLLRSAEQNNTWEQQMTGKLGR
jgi:hypothetical protein